MANTLKQFDFVLQGGENSQAGAVRMNPTLYICLTQWTKMEGSAAPVLSPDLMSEGEIDGYIGLLIADLEGASCGRETRVQESRASNPRA